MKKLLQLKLISFFPYGGHCPLVAPLGIKKKPGAEGIERLLEMAPSSWEQSFCVFNLFFGIFGASLRVFCFQKGNCF
jgi:hypothetical protein